MWEGALRLLFGVVRIGRSGIGPFRNRPNGPSFLGSFGIVGPWFTGFLEHFGNKIPFGWSKTNIKKKKKIIIHQMGPCRNKSLKCSGLHWKNSMFYAIVLNENSLQEYRKISKDQQKNSAFVNTIADIRCWNVKKYAVFFYSLYTPVENSDILCMLATNISYYR